MRKLRELRAEVVRLQRRAHQKARRGVPCGCWENVAKTKRARFYGEAGRALSVERRMAKLAEAVVYAGGGVL